MWSFYLDAGEGFKAVDEPLGWDTVEFKLRREDNYQMEFSFSDSLQFDGLAARMLLNAYNTFGIDADVKINILKSGCAFSYDGVINFAIYKEEDSCEDCYAGGLITVGIRQSSFSETFKNRLDTAINLDSNISMDGEAMGSIEPFDLKLHSKEIFFESTYKINESLAKVNTSELDSFIIVPPFQADLNELEGTLEPSFYVSAFGNPLFYSGFSFAPGIEQRTIKLKLRLAGEITSAESGFLVLRVFTYDIATSSQTSLDTIYSLPVQANVKKSFDSGVITLDASLPVNRNLGIYVSSQNNLTPQSGGSDAYYEFNASSFLSLSENSLITPSSAKAYFLFDAFSRICENYTGKRDCFKSDFFQNGVGCGHYITLTNGKNIRRMLDKDGNLLPIVCSFKKLYDALDAIFCLGFRVEMENGASYVRVEPRKYFYQKESKHDFTFASKVTKSIALEHLYNEFEVGYSKWETQGVNGNDEFNSKRNYAIPVKGVKRKLSAVCQLIAGGFLIEQTRRQQFKETPTKDFATDDDLFLICANRMEITSNRYEIDASGDPLEKIYQPGMVAERNEFFSVENLLSPDTAYNLRLSPAHMAAHWYPVLAACLQFQPGSAIKFLSGTGNYLMQTSSSDNCLASQQINENSDLSAALMLPDYRQALYYAESYDYESPLFFDEFLLMIIEANYAYSHGCSEQNLTGGYIREATYRPNKEGGMVRMKTIRANLT